MTMLPASGRKRAASSSGLSADFFRSFVKNCASISIYRKVSIPESTKMVKRN